MRRCSTAASIARRPCSRSTATIRPRGPPGVHRGHQLQDARAAAPGRHPGHRHARPMRPAIASAARPAPPRSSLNGHYTSTAVVTSFAGVFPMDEPRYVMVVMLDDPKADRRNLRLPHRGVEHRRRRSARPSAGSRRCSASGPTRTASRTCREVLPFVHDTQRRNKHRCACATSRTSTAIPKSRALPSTIARSRRAPCSARSRAPCSTARISSPQAVERGAVAVVARPEATVERRAAPRRSRAAAAVRRARRANSSRPIPETSSRSPAPTARPRRSR